MENNALTNSEHTNPLGYVEIPKLILKYAVPAVVGMVINSIYNIVDQIFIGRGVGYLGNTATTISFPFVTLAMALSLMIAHGNATYMNLKQGEKNREEASKSFGVAIVFSLFTGLIIAAVSTIFMDKLLVLFGATEASFSYAKDYASITVLGMPLISVSQCMNNATRSDGSPNYAMLTLVSGAIINTILDPVFIFVFNWGVKGAAFATVIGQLFSCVIALLYMKKFKNIDIKREYFKLKAFYIKKIAYLGTSNFITQFSGLITQVVLTNTLKYWGALSEYGAEIPIAAVGITSKVNMIVIAVLMGIANSQQPIIGYNYGAKQYDRVKKTYLTSSLIATGVGVFGWLMFQIFPEQIISIFGQESALYNEFAVKALTTYLSLVFIAGFAMSTSSLFQSIGKPGIAALLTLSRQILVLVPLIILLPRYFGVVGVLYAMPITDMIMLVVTSILSRMEIKNLNKNMLLQAEIISDKTLAKQM